MMHLPWRHLLLVPLCAACLCHAAPAASDPIERTLQEKGLIERLGNQATQIGKSVSQTGQDLIGSALTFLGTPYKRGGTDAETGFDCSGFVQSLYKNTLGRILPRTSREQAQSTKVITQDELQPGDLVFFNTMKRAFSHVGIYMGDHKFIHSPRSGQKVRIEDMRSSYWSKRFDGARRVTDPQEREEALRLFEQGKAIHALPATSP